VDAYLLIKTVHVISAAVLFGTGAGIAFFMLMGQKSPSFEARRFSASATVRADFLFTLPAVVIQPVSGAWLIWQGGYDWADAWLLVTYGLYVIAGLCWIPVVIIQIKIKRMLQSREDGDKFDDARLSRLVRLWFALGWPAFGGLVVVFYLMVAKPSW
jgi:uncharacterized membrane protein